MILINKVEHTAKVVCEMFGLPYGKIVSRPEFLINPDFKFEKAGQSKEISVKAGTKYPAKFMARHNGMSLEIRYAESYNDRTVGEKIVTDYEPRKITFIGESMILKEDQEDLAVYLVLVPYSKTSPFRPIDQPYGWYFKDLEEESEVELSKNNALMLAMATINNYEGEPLKVIAKGFGITGVEGLPAAYLKNELIKKATADPVQFNTDINSNTIAFKGLIMNGVDNGMFVKSSVGGNDKWIWGATENKGQVIANIPNGGAKAVDILMDTIMSRIDVYYPILVSSQRAVSAQKVAEAFLSNQSLDLNSVFQPQNIPAGSPGVHQNAQDAFKGKYDYNTEYKAESEFGGGTDEISHQDELKESDIKIDLNKDYEDPEDPDLNEELNADQDLNVDTQDQDDVEVPSFLTQDQPTKKGGRPPKQK